MNSKGLLSCLFVFMCLGSVICAERDFARNGDFYKQVIVPPSEWTIRKILPGWEVIKEYQIGYGRVYNGRWGNKVIIELDSNQNDVLRQKINLEAGDYFIEVEYAARGGLIANSQMSISWNGKKIRLIKAQDQEIHIERIPVTAVSGQNTLQIAGEGPSDGLGMTVSGVNLFYSGTYNFVKNGDFYKQVIVPPREWNIRKNLPAWQVVKQYQIGKGRIYNPRWANKVVIELDSKQNDVLRQKINLEAGDYFIEIEYAGRVGSLPTSQMSISWNGKKIRLIKALDEEIHIERIPVTAVSGQNILQIAGEGPSDGFGMTVSRIGLF